MSSRTSLKIVAERMVKRGTPKTLHEAIANGVVQAEFPYVQEHVVEVAAHCIAPHIRDFLSQRFNVEMLRGNDAGVAMLKRLWNDITGEEI